MRETRVPLLFRERHFLLNIPLDRVPDICNATCSQETEDQKAQSNRQQHKKKCPQQAFKLTWKQPARLTTLLRNHLVRLHNGETVGTFYDQAIAIGSSTPDYRIDPW